MVSLKAQMRLHEASREATSALESSSRRLIEAAFEDWNNGVLSGTTVRYRLERIVRQSYRSSASIARQVAVESSGLSGWSPDEVFNTEYLQDLIQDIRRNLRAVKAGELTQDQVISRMSHTAGVAAQRGYTDQTISAYSELEGFGFRLRKFWLANFVNNTPCPACTRLHGTEVGLHESFRTETGEPGVYRDLIGPPRHPRCRCRLFIFISSLDTAFEKPNFDVPQDAPQMISTDDVKKMSNSVFETIRASVASILAFFRRKK